jgi:hypothetical protein
MTLRRLLLLSAISFSHLASSAECTMKPARIDVARIVQNSAIKAYVVGDGSLSFSALLKNGSALKLIHSGCDHSGASVSLWLDANAELSDTDFWIKKAGYAARIAFRPEIAADIIKSMQDGSFETRKYETRTVISASPSSFMSYSIVISKTEDGPLLTLSYELG